MGSGTGCNCFSKRKQIYGWLIIIFNKKEYQKQWKKDNFEHVRKYEEQYRKNNPEKIKGEL